MFFIANSNKVNHGSDLAKVSCSFHDILPNYTRRECGGLLMASLDKTNLMLGQSPTLIPQKSTLQHLLI